MNEPMQYITNEQGDRVGVVLDLTTYQRLTNAPRHDPECLLNLSVAELEALAESKLAPAKQENLSVLLEKNKESQLSSEESTTLDILLEQIDITGYKSLYERR
ncbi:MAG: hypothetical protein J7647_07600 [Cyanobacteria bacterium SBLK]|nr:hypothetical protein [Cyanobacteria bacterium SBLK]